MIFVGGCNLKCPFCHNPGLVLEPDQYPDFPLDELLAELSRRRNFIDGLVVSGGEPTLGAGLPDFLREVKRLGLQIKVDSNGLLPQVLQQLFDLELIDFLAIDLKTAPERYGELHDRAVDVSALLESCRLTMERAPEYEFRTTCVPDLVGVTEIHRIGETILGAKRWVLQQYVPREQLLGKAPQQAYPTTKFESLQRIAAGFVESVEGRGW